jgi:hypothetical protein
MRTQPSGTVRLLSVLIATFVLTQPVLAQQDASVRPVPRLPSGEVNLGAPPGEIGTWSRSDTRSMVAETDAQLALRDRGGRPNPPNPLNLKPLFSEVPFQPWAEALYMYRLEHEIEPYGRCKPSGGMRNMSIPYGTDIVQVPEEKRMYLFHTGGSHTFRIIYMDGRPHPDDLDPSYGGHSVGHWEGDTLVVDSIGFNERGWIDSRGIPNTTKLHLVERFTRLDFDTLSYEMIVDDPGAYTATWKTGMLINWTPDIETFQFLCQDGNLADELMIGGGNTLIDRTSPIVP